MSIKLLDDGTIINTTRTRVDEIIVLDINRYPGLKEFNSIVKELSYEPDGVYLPDSVLPIIKFGDFLDIDNYRRVINSVEDFISAIEDSSSTITLNGYRLNKAIVKYQKKFFSSTPPYDVGFKLLEEYLESYIMLYEHFDSKIVLEDSLNITSGTVLVNLSASKFDDFTEYLAYNVENVPNEILYKGRELYSKILNDILDNIRDLQNHSFSIEINSNRVSIISYASPIERRYMLATEEL